MKNILEKLFAKVLGATELDFLEWGLYLYLFLLPWQARYFLMQKPIGGVLLEAGNIGVYVTDVLLMILIGLFGKILWQNRKTGLWGELKSISWIFIVPGISFLSLFWSEEILFSTYWSIRLLAASILFCIIFISRIRFHVVSFILLFSAVIQGFIGMEQFVLQEDLFGNNKWLGVSAHDPATLGTSVVDTGYRRWLRAYGTLPHPNVLGGFCVIGLFGVMMWKQDVISRIGKIKEYTQKQVKQIEIEKLGVICSFVLIFTGLLLSFSRSAYLAFITGVVFLIFVLRIKKIKQWQYWKITFVKLGGIALLITLLFISVYLPLFQTRFGAGTRLEGKSISERIIQVLQSEKLIKLEFPWGVGTGNYIFELEQFLGGLPGWAYQPVHNIYLLMIVEWGVLGILFFLGIVGFLFFELKYLYRSQINHWTIFWFSLFMSLLMIGFFDHYLWTLWIGQVLLFSVLGFYIKSKQL